MMTVRCRSLLVTTLGLVAWSASFPAEAQDLQVRATRDGAFVTVSASAVMKADQGMVWSVLSDYEHLAAFIPDIKSSRVVWRKGNLLHLEQTGDVGILFFKEPVTMLLEVYEEPPTRISARGLKGNVKGLETSYELHPIEGGTKLVYAGRFEPDFPIPPLIGMPIVNRLMERRFRAMVNEVKRREALASEASKQPRK